MPLNRTRAEIDADFTLDSVPDLDAVFARRARASEEALARFDVRYDIPYGAGAEETLILFPAAAPDAPVQMFIHGGFWSTLAARDFAFVAEGFVPCGAAVAVIDYPLIPTVRMAAIVESCLRAVSYLYRHGSGHGIDPQRIFLSGNSAGAHLVTEAMDRERLRAAGLPADAVKGGTAISGLYDLTSIAGSFRNELLQFTDDEVAAFSPLLRPPNITQPIIVTVGENETWEFLDQSARLAAHGAEGGSPVEHMVVPDTNHITVVLDSFAKRDEPLNRAVRTQMGLG